MAYELKALELDVSDDFMINCLMNSMPENHTKHAQNDKFPTVCVYTKIWEKERGNSQASRIMPIKESIE